jgi:hypothetical protein
MHYPCAGESTEKLPPALDHRCYHKPIRCRVVEVTEASISAGWHLGIVRDCARKVWYYSMLIGSVSGGMFRFNRLHRAASRRGYGRSSSTAAQVGAATLPQAAPINAPPLSAESLRQSHRDRRQLSTIALPTGAAFLSAGNLSWGLVDQRLPWRTPFGWLESGYGSHARGLLQKAHPACSHTSCHLVPFR